jgi:hypothetical protein
VLGAGNVHFVHIDIVDRRAGGGHVRRVITMQLIGVEHVSTQDFGHRLKQRCNFAYPASKNRALQLDAFRCKDLRLAIQRRRDYVCQQASALEVRDRSLAPSPGPLQLIFGRT